MEDEAHRVQQQTKDREHIRALRYQTKIGQMLCGKAALRTELVSEKPDILEFRFEVFNDGCKEMRRHGSRYCQTCSDKHALTKSI